MDRSEFERLVEMAINTVPKPFAEAFEDPDPVGVVVEERAPSKHGPLYGLYQGHPATDFGRPPSGALPPLISIYMYPMLDVFRSEEEIVQQVNITLLHELGHHLGLDEGQLDERGYG